MTKVKIVALGNVAIACLVLLVVGAHVHYSQTTSVIGWIFRISASGYALGLILQTVIGYRKLTNLGKSAAKAIVAAEKAVYGGKPHEYRVVSLEEMPHLDRGYYEQTRNWFEANGFRFVGDLDVADLTQAFNASRTAIRTFIGEDQSVIGAAYHAMFPARPHFPAWEIRRIEFETELSDGTYVCTTTEHKMHISRFPGIELGTLPGESSPAELLQSHRGSVLKRIAKNPEIVATRFQGIDDVIAASHRMDALEGAPGAPSTGAPSAKG